MWNIVVKQLLGFKGATENAGVENAGVSRMEHQTEIISEESYVI